MKLFRLYLLASLLLFINNHFSPISASVPSDTLIESYLAKSVHYTDRLPDSSYYFANKAMELARAKSAPAYISKASQALGKYFTNKEDFGKATRYFLDALKIEETRKDEKRIADLNDNLGRIYYCLENYHKALAYYTNALVTYKKIKDTLNIAGTICHLGSLTSNREFCEHRTKLQKTIDFETAIQYFEQALTLFEKKNSKSGVANCYHNLAAVYNKLQQPEKARRFLLKVLSYYKETNDWDGQATALYDLGKSYYRMKDYQHSIECYQNSLKIAKEKNLTGGIQFLYEAMSDAYNEAHDYKNARDYYVKYMTLRDSVYNAEKSKQIYELETKYQTEKKEKEIQHLTFLKKRKNLFIIILIGSFLMTTLIGLYAFNRVHSKRIIAEQANELNRQKIKELEKHHQLIATQLVLQGEETERSRLARDLHDGLGGLLSGVKLTLSNIKGNVVLSSESVIQYDKALAMLDSSIKELRRVAHNMMPESLVKFGLKDALGDFCNNLENKQIPINYQCFGEESRFDPKIEISLYRIAQELINNAFKHSQATELLVQLVQEKDRVNLTVQDNGKGFDPVILKTSKGAGIANIRSRVESLRGRLDLVSEPDKGTEISIEFKL
jgi:signal transduction histidine kinase